MTCPTAHLAITWGINEEEKTCNTYITYISDAACAARLKYHLLTVNVPLFPTSIFSIIILMFALSDRVKLLISLFRDIQVAGNVD